MKSVSSLSSTHTSTLPEVYHLTSDGNASHLAAVQPPTVDELLVLIHSKSSSTRSLLGTLASLALAWHYVHCTPHNELNSLVQSPGTYVHCIAFL